MPQAFTQIEIETLRRVAQDYALTNDRIPLQIESQRRQKATEEDLWLVRSTEDKNAGECAMCRIYGAAIGDPANASASALPLIPVFFRFGNVIEDSFAYAAFVGGNMEAISCQCWFPDPSTFTLANLQFYKHDAGERCAKWVDSSECP